jgi:hypothetical protein
MSEVERIVRQFAAKYKLDADILVHNVIAMIPESDNGVVSENTNEAIMTYLEDLAFGRTKLVAVDDLDDEFVNKLAFLIELSQSTTKEVNDSIFTDSLISGLGTELFESDDSNSDDNGTILAITKVVNKFPINTEVFSLDVDNLDIPLCSVDISKSLFKHTLLENATFILSSICNITAIANKYSLLSYDEAKLSISKPYVLADSSDVDYSIKYYTNKYVKFPEKPNLTFVIALIFDKDLEDVFKLLNIQYVRFREL